MSDGKREMETSTINKYIDNKNYANDLYSELHEKRSEEGNSSSDYEETVSQFHEIQKEIKEIEKTKPRYCSKEDISTLEVREYSFTDDKHLTLKRNFISDVELDDLKHLMVMVNDHITENVDIENDVPQVERLMKSLVRIVHRFNYTRGHSVPVVETMQSRDVMTII